ncbi:hypothetical protein CAEBREN_08889 [Caenorhabditis brenneri]|uniref:Uncharacterized protein n=1 Tax=Caenorhabditis brenneri TaxID=135651 RepID=G0MVE4_CAEBE|nr:hypothetical protein CAEBREN_08889 [Caenorhabditis brenneri]
MVVRISLLASLLVLSTLAFECSPDTILRMATNKREKQLERECHEEKTGQDKCVTKDELEKSWKEFQDVSDQYKEAVAQCRNYVDAKSRPKRSGFSDIDHALYDHPEGGIEIDTVYEQTERRYPESFRKMPKRLQRRNGGTVLDGDMGDPTDGQDTNDHARKRRHHSKEGHHSHDGKHQENMDHKKHEDGNLHERVRRNDDHDPNDPNQDHTGHNHRRRRSDDHDPNDPNVDHTGHNHRRRRHNDDPNDTTIDHTGHNHRMRRSGDHDPNDPNIDHTGHNHRRRRHNDDPNDDTIDHTGHNHRMRRSGDHDPNDPNIDHTGHNHRRRRHHAMASRIRRTVCSTAGHDQLSAMSTKFSKHCERENICLPDEDLPKGKQQDDILALQKLRAKKYSEYLTQVSKCYGKL